MIQIGHGFYLWVIVLIWGCIICIITMVLVWKKYTDHDQKSSQANLVSNRRLTKEVSQVQMSRTKTKTKSKIAKKSIKYSNTYKKTKTETFSRYLPKISDQSADDNDNDDDKPDIDPKKKAVLKYYFLIMGFISAIAWMDVVADELINILTTLGIVSDIDLGILGLTILAMGNSIGDIVACIGVSKKGYPTMAIAAAIGGSTLNILIGLGLGTMIVVITDNDRYHLNIPLSSSIFYGCIGTAIGITTYFLAVACSSWKLTKLFGYFCYLYYTVFLIINVLAYIYPDIFFGL